MDRPESTEELGERLREVAPALEAARRARIRHSVLRRLPGGPRVSDRVYAAFAMLALPTPYLLHALAIAVIAASLLGLATVAASASLPEEPLYGLKLAAEQVRLDLARSPEDRAGVELSIAEHRLSEAERLAVDGREDAALVAWSEYGARVASAAAELAQVELVVPKSAPLVAQLKTHLTQQRAKAAVVARRLAADPKTALAGRALATIATTIPADDETVSVGIADAAARVAHELEIVAAERAEVPAPTPRDSIRSQLAPVKREAAPPERQVREAPAKEANARAVRTPNASIRATFEAAQKAAERAHQAAKKAREAAERAKETIRRGPPAEDQTRHRGDDEDKDDGDDDDVDDEKEHRGSKSGKRPGR